MTEPQSNVHEALVQFYSGRKTAPDAYAYTDTGDLVKYAIVKKKGGGIELGAEEQRISLPTYRPLTKEERETQEAEYRQRVLDAEGAFEGARRELRELIREREVLQAAGGGAAGAGAADAEGGEPVGEEGLKDLIILKNIEIGDLDRALMDARSALQVVLGKKVIRPALFIDDSRIETSIPVVYILAKRPFTLQQTYIRVQEEGAGVRKQKRKAVVTEAAAPLEVVRVRVVKPTSIEGTGINAFLNPWFPVRIIYKGEGFVHAYQALMASVAREVGDAEAAAQILAATTPEAMTYTPREGIPVETYNRALMTLLMDVTREKFKQNPELGVRLLQTGTDRIVIVPPKDPLDTVLGTGLDTKNPDIKDPSKWTGQNRLGSALEHVRNELQAKQTEEKSAMAAAMEAAIDTAGAAGAAGAGAAAAVAATTGAVIDAAGGAFSDAFEAIGDVLGVGEEAGAPAAPAPAPAVAAAPAPAAPAVAAAPTEGVAAAPAEEVIAEEGEEDV